MGEAVQIGISVLILPSNSSFVTPQRKKSRNFERNRERRLWVKYHLIHDIRTFGKVKVLASAKAHAGKAGVNPT
jgi:hypothetical protein